MIRTPKELEEKMKLWRKGLVPLPQDYIAFHESAARKSIENDFAGYTVHKTFMDNDGWGDGMQFLHAIIEDKKTGKLEKIKWADGGNWYIDCHPGWGLWMVVGEEK